MKMRILLTAFLFFLSIPGVPAAWAESQHIAIIVNEEAISTSDVTARLNMVISSSGLPNTPEIRSKLASQIVNALVEEQLKLQEARKLNLEVTEEDVRHGLNAIAQQNNMTPNTFFTMLQKSRISIETMKRQVRSQIAWTKVIQKKLRPKIRISEKDIDSALERLELNEGKNEYLVSEIFLPVEDPDEEQNIKQLARRLANEIKNNKAPFFKVAQQFSKAAGSMNGGDLGWVSQDQLPREVETTLGILRKGELSQPVRSLNGYHIMLLRDIRTISPETIPSRDDISSNLGLQRLDRLQRRHYMDLKSAAYIENRV